MSNFSLASGLQIGNGQITGNGSFTVWTSSVQNNPNGNTSLRLIIDYSAAVPEDQNITAVVESQQGNNWYPVAYQFNPLITIGVGPKRIIQLQPDISVYNTGIDDDMYVGGLVIARISRFQGKLGENFRVKLIVSENNYGLSNAFQNITVSIYGEQY